jgi:hypothetical protein
MGELLAPYQYEMLWALSREPLAASELLSTWPCSRWDYDYGNAVLAMSNRLRPLVTKGLLVNEGGIYRLTKEAVCRFSVW